MTIPDPVRKAVQTALAAVLSLAVMRVAGLPEASWAVISAVFVMQPSAGGTVGSVLDRILAALGGTAIGLALLFLMGNDGWRAPAALVVAAAAVELAAWRRPGWRFGHVPAAILILSDMAGGVMATAAWRALAIALGAVVAALVALSVLPEPAHRRLRGHLAAALRRCGALLTAAVDELLGAGEADLMPMHGDAQAHLEQAATLAGQSRRRRFHRAGGPEFALLVHAVQRLWHSLVILDRVDGQPLPETPRRRLAAPLRALARDGCGYLDAAAEALEAGEAPPAPDSVQDRLGDLTATLDALRCEIDAADLPVREAQRLFALGFALEQLTATFDGLAACFRRAEAPQAATETRRA